MPREIFVNLPVKDLAKSMDFFGKLGFTFNAQFTNETAACMVISETIYSMLLTHAKFREFTPNAICDTARHTEALIALSCENRAEVDAQVDKALAAGASEARPPMDHGFMYERAFRDLDGHIWELFWMDPATVRSGD